MGLHRVARRWEELARTDPLWAVLSQPEKRGNRWEIEEFFRTGKAEIESVLGYLSEVHPVPETGRVLDFGCGVGRLTQALADHFEKVDGLDVSASMVDLARSHNRHGDRCTYHQNQGTRLPFPDSVFDFIYSNITLQHIPPRAARRYILEFFRTLSPRGVALFQQTANPLPASTPFRRIARRLLPRAAAEALREVRLAWKQMDSFEMHGVSRSVVETLVRRGGADLVDVVENHSGGDGWTSFRYCAVKR